MRCPVMPSIAVCRYQKETAKCAARLCQASPSAGTKRKPQNALPGYAKHTLRQTQKGDIEKRCPVMFFLTGFAFITQKK